MSRGRFLVRRGVAEAHSGWYAARGPLAKIGMSLHCKTTMFFLLLGQEHTREGHSVVAPILAAPLLTGIRRSTVGPGTREDIACVVGGVRRTCPTSEYLPAPAVSVLPEYDCQYMARCCLRCSVSGRRRLLKQHGPLRGLCTRGSVQTPSCRCAGFSACQDPGSV